MRISTLTRPMHSLFIAMIIASTATFSNLIFAADGEEIEVVNVQELMSGGFWDKVKQKFYQTLFKEAGDIETKLLEQDHFKLNLKFGRVLLDYEDPNRFSLADHFGLTLKADIPIGGVFKIGGHLGSNLLRIRDIQKDKFTKPGPHLKEDLASWDPEQPVAEDIQDAYLENIGPIFNQIEKEIKAGKTQNAKKLFENEIPEKKYLDLFAGLKLPFEMPWTAQRVLNNKILKPSDIASFETDGGVFARVEADFGGVKGPWIGAFLRGHYRTSILKVTDTKILLRVETAKQYGTDWGLFDAKFKIPVSDGLLFGSDLKVGIKPISIRGENYRSKLFARVYEMQLTTERVKRAYNAAIHGNLTLLDDLGKEEGSGVAALSERYEEGLHSRQRVHVNLLVLKIKDDKSSDVLDRNFWDERGEFHQFAGLGLENSYEDVNLILINIGETRNSEFTIEAFPLAPDAVYQPRIAWRLEKINQKAKSADQTAFKNFLMGFKPDTKSDDIKKLLKKKKIRASAEIQIHPKGYEQLQALTAEQLWKNASRLLFNDEKVWSTNRNRQTWLQDNSSTTIQHAIFGNLGTGDSLYSRVNSVAKFLVKKPDPTQLSKWYVHQIGWAQKSNWRSFMPRLMLDAVSPENRYIELELESDSSNEFWTWSEGTKDITIYPDDWEYISIPELD